MHTGIATSAPVSRIASGGSGAPEPTSATMTLYATIAPIITTSPCAKLMSWMMP